MPNSDQQQTTPTVLALCVLVCACAIANEPDELLTIQSHKRGVSSVAFSPDGNHIVCGGYNSSVKIWDVATGKHVATLDGHRFGVTSVAFSPDGRKLVSGSSDGTVRIWNFDYGLTQTVMEPKSLVRDVKYSRDGKWIVGACANSERGKVVVWDSQSGVETLSIRAESDTVSSVDINPNGSLIVSVDGITASVWDRTTGTRVRTLDVGGVGAVCAAFSWDGESIATGNPEGIIKVWDVGTGRELREMAAKKAIRNIAFSQDGTWLATSGFEANVRVWNLDHPAESLVLPGKDSDALGVGISPDSKKVAVSRADGTITVWRIAD